MQATFIQLGDSIDYTPGANVAGGAVVVQGTLVGVARRPIAASVLGSLAVRGIFLTSLRRKAVLGQDLSRLTSIVPRSHLIRPDFSSTHWRTEFLGRTTATIAYMAGLLAYG